MAASHARASFVKSAALGGVGNGLGPASHHHLPGHASHRDSGGLSKLAPVARAVTTTTAAFRGGNATKAAVPTLKTAMEVAPPPRVVVEDLVLPPPSTWISRFDVRPLLQWHGSTGPAAGLMNAGNTCYMNSCLQCLASTPALVQFLEADDHPSKCTASHDGFCLWCYLSMLITRMRQAGSEGRPLFPAKLANHPHLVSKMLRPGRQEDSHEFLRCCLERLCRISCKAAGVAPSRPDRLDETTPFSHLFGGYFRNQVRCTACGFDSNTYDSFQDLSLEVGNGITSVSKALQHFASVETLDIDNMWKCPRCKRPVRAKKQLTIRKPPPVLTVHLKRFSFVPSSKGAGGSGGIPSWMTMMGLGGFGGGRKLTAHIDFPAELDITPALSDTAIAEGHCTKYDLHGVLVHHGTSPHSGHYFAYVKADNGTWHCANDDHVCKAGWHIVEKQQAYMLFYSQQTPDATKPMPSLASSPPPPLTARAPEPATATPATLDDLAPAKWAPPPLPSPLAIKVPTPLVARSDSRNTAVSATVYGSLGTGGSATATTIHTTTTPEGGSDAARATTAPNTLTPPLATLSRLPWRVLEATTTAYTYHKHQWDTVAIRHELATWAQQSPTPPKLTAAGGETVATEGQSTDESVVTASDMVDSSDDGAAESEADHGHRPDSAPTHAPSAHTSQPRRATTETVELVTTARARRFDPSVLQPPAAAALGSSWDDDDTHLRPATTATRPNDGHMGVGSKRSRPSEGGGSMHAKVKAPRHWRPDPTTGRLHDEEYAAAMTDEQWNEELDVGKVKKVKGSAASNPDAAGALQRVLEDRVASRSAGEGGRGYRKGHDDDSRRGGRGHGRYGCGSARGRGHGRHRGRGGHGFSGPRPRVAYTARTFQ